MLDRLARQVAVRLQGQHHQAHRAAVARCGRAARDIGFSIFAFNDYFIATTGNAGVDYVATRRLTLRTGIAAERDDYDVAVLGNDRRDTMSFTSVGFTYVIGRFATGLDVGYFERDSTFGGDEDSGIRFLIHLSFNP